MHRKGRGMFGLRMSIAVTLCLVLQTGAAMPQEADERQYWDALKEGRYLEALEVARVPEGVPPQAAETYMEQLNGWLYSMTGRHFLAYGLEDGVRADEAIEIPATYRGLEATDAVAAIREAASGHRIVIINEAHHDARHRAFATLLIEGLAADGFTHFAAETFGAQDDLDRAFRNGAPELELGFYAIEPFFGDMIRQAFALGLRPVRYEQTAEQACSGECGRRDRIRAREQAQARNLAEAIAENPDGRFLVYVGYNHVDERGDEDGDGILDGWMAAELKALTGLDPLTVDQEAGSGYGDRRIPPVHARLVQAYDVTAPTVFRRSDGSWFTDPESRTVDMLVVHPRLEAGQGGRPDWLPMDGYRLPVPIGQTLLPPDRPILLQAFVDGEALTSIPMDQYLLRDGETGDVMLMLPAGRYRLRVQRSTGDDVEIAPLRVR
jgi:hypothetical protein